MKIIPSEPEGLDMLFYYVSAGMACNVGTSGSCTDLYIDFCSPIIFDDQMPVAGCNTVYKYTSNKCRYWANTIGCPFTKSGIAANK